MWTQMKIYSAVFKLRKKWRATWPPPMPLFWSDHFLVEIVERPNNYPFGDIMTPIARGERSLSYKICLLFTYSIFIDKYAYILCGGGGEFSARGIFHRDIFPWGGKFPGGKFFRGDFALEELARIPIRNSSYVLLSHCRLNFTRIILSRE